MISFSENLFLPVFLSGLIFFIGLFGVLVRRNVLVILMSLELMLNGVNLNILSFARIYGWEEGPVLVFFIMTLAAAAAGVG
ncbi:MAG: NADH-quinone oxidoreductase subunit NuoK, partial [Bdellovibrionales bacterium]|nr:NADH-quinone oxidoreductase subunit NuoK [Bdellovibrionales bacterium]